MAGLSKKKLAQLEKVAQETQAFAPVAAACYQQRKKNQQRIYQADRRSAERALNAFYNAMWEQERRERLNAAHKAFHEQRAQKE